MQRGLYLSVNQQMCEWIRVQQFNPTNESGSEAHAFEQLEHGIPIDSIKSLLEVLEQRVCLLVETSCKGLEISKKAHVVMDRAASDKPFLIRVDKLPDKICRRNVSAFEST